MRRLRKLNRPKIYSELLPVLRERAWELGYALGTHGTMRRDMDLIAAPWIENAVSPEPLARALSACVNGYLACRADGTANVARKPLGRQAFVIHLFRPRRWPIGEHLYIDLSVAPRGAASDA